MKARVPTDVHAFHMEASSLTGFVSVAGFGGKIVRDSHCCLLGRLLGRYFGLDCVAEFKHALECCARVINRRRHLQLLIFDFCD